MKGRAYLSAPAVCWIMEREYMISRSSSWAELFQPDHMAKNNVADDSATADISGAYAPSRYRRDTVSSSSTLTVDYGGLLTKDAPLTSDDQNELRKVLAAWKARQPPSASDSGHGVPSLIALLLRAVPEAQRPVEDEPAKVLDAILNSPEGQALGKRLQDSIDAFAGETSVRDVLLSALALDVDPAGGLNRNELAGYSLRQTGNWGYPPAEIVKRFEAHLATRFGEACAKVIAFQLLSISAPEFLVKGLPPTIMYGSHQWATFSAAVSRIEARQPGSAADKTYQEIMTLDEKAPVIELEKREQQFAQLAAIIDWAIANSVITEKNDDAYTPEEIELAVNAMQAQQKVLADSVEALNKPMPTRRELALIHLRRVYGAESEKFFELPLFAEEAAGSPDRKDYSLLDIYMSGDLGKHPWISSDPVFTTAKVSEGIPKLPKIKELFDEKFNAYAEGLKEAAKQLFKYQLSLLPLEDRKMIEYGKVTTFNLTIPEADQGPVSPDHPIQPYIKSGAVLISAQLNGKTVHYLYSPAKGRIIKDADPTRPGLQFPGSRLYFSMPRPDVPGDKEAAVTIMWQTVGGRSPKRDPVDFFAFSIYPNKTLEYERQGEHPDVLATFSSAKTEALAGSVSAYYTRGMDETKAEANGSTRQEQEQQRTKTVQAFFLSLIPFYSAGESFANGRPVEGMFYLALDLFGFFIPALKGGIQGVKVGVKSGMGATLSFIKGGGIAALKAANPLQPVFDAGRGVFNLGKAGFKKLRGSGWRSGHFDLPLAGGKDSIADGIYRPLGANSDAVPVRAVERNGKWYAVDGVTGTPYGAPLRGFVHAPRSAIIDTSVNIATDVVTSVATNLVQTRLDTRHERPDVRVAGLSPGDAQVADADTETEFVEPAVRARLEASMKDATKVLQSLRELLPDVKKDDFTGADQPREMINQLERELFILEDGTSRLAEDFSVFYKAWNPDKGIDQTDAGLAERVAMIEKRITAMKDALAQMQAKLEGMPAHR